MEEITVKKGLLFFCTVLLMWVSLAGCSLAEGDGVELSFTPEETREMSNFMNKNRYVTVGGVLYGQGWDGKLFRAEPVVSGKTVTLKNTRVLMKDAEAVSFTYHEGKVYCCLQATYKNQESVISFDCETDEVAVIYTGKTDYLQGCEDGLYFVDEDGFYCRMDYTGENKTVILERAVFHPYRFREEWLIFQDDSDGERLHLRNLNTGEEMTLTDRRGFRSILCGDTLYYCSAVKGKNVYTLSRVNLKTLENEHSGYRIGSSFFVDGEEIWFADDTHMSLEEAWEMQRDVEDYDSTGLSYLYSNGEIYVRYGWKQKKSALTVSRMLILPCGETKNGTELRVK